MADEEAARVEICRVLLNPPDPGRWGGILARLSGRLTCPAAPYHRRPPTPQGRYPCRARWAGPGGLDDRLRREQPADQFGARRSSSAATSFSSASCASIWSSIRGSTTASG